MSVSRARMLDGSRSSPWWAMVALQLAFVMVVVDATSVNVALPVMLSELDTDLGQIVWVSTAYSLALSVPLLLFSRLGDRVGPKRVFGVGLVFFTVASLACGSATDALGLIAARAVQGLAAAAMTPHMLTFVTHLFPPGKRGTPMGLAGAIGGAGAVSGFLFGGVLVDTLGWRWIFFINVPIGIIALAFTVRYLPDWQPGHSHRFDLPGVALSCCGLAAVVFGIQEGAHYHWARLVGPLTIPQLIAAGLLLLVCFVVWQHLNPREPLLDLRLFGIRNLSMSAVAQLTGAFAVPGMWIPLTLYLQTGRGLSPLAAGLISAPVSAAGAVLSPIGGWLSDRVGGKWVSTVGFCAYGAGVLLLMLQLRPDTDPWQLIPALLVVAVGVGFLFPPLNNIGLTGLVPQLVGSGAGVLRTAQRVGSVLGAAAAATVVQARIATASSPGTRSSETAAAVYADGARAALLLVLTVLAIGAAACLAMNKPQSAAANLPSGSKPS